jgi:enoyl-CoA hydratase
VSGALWTVKTFRSGAAVPSSDGQGHEPHDASVHATVRDDGILEITLDDSGPNALRPEVLDALRSTVQQHPDRAVLLRGRPGMFSAGLDLRFMAAAGPEGIGELLEACGRALHALWLHPRPLVVLAEGHAIAAGTMLAMTGDHVVTVEGGTWGLNETANGMEIPRFGILLAAARLTPRDLDRLLIAGTRVDAATAVAVGFADELAPAHEAAARAEERLAELAALPAHSYAGNKHRVRGAAARTLLEGLTSDVAELVAGLRRAQEAHP